MAMTTAGSHGGRLHTLDHGPAVRRGADWLTALSHVADETVASSAADRLMNCFFRRTLGHGPVAAVAAPLVGRWPNLKFTGFAPWGLAAYGAVAWKFSFGALQADRLLAAPLIG